MVVLAACSGTDSASDPGEVLALRDDTPVRPTTSLVETSTSTTIASTSTTSIPGADASSADEQDDTVSGTPAGSAADAPPTGSGAPSDIMAAYTGALGGYGVDDLLYGRPANLPSVATGLSPLTGLPSSRSARSAIVVKIDNSSKARPQAGLDQADVVIEQEVEGGVTRLAAIFQTSAPERIGPVRSARTTDLSFLSALGRPGLAYSGANDVVDTLIIRQERVRNYSAARFGGYWRDSSRSAPANLYTGISQFSTDAAAPPAWFQFAAEPSEQGSPVASFTARFPSTSATWTWSGSAWERAQGGGPHRAESGNTIQAANVVVAEVVTIDSGLRDTTGASAPEQVWVGQGRVAVFTNGRRVDGTWTRSTLGEPTVFVADDGSVIEFTPGVTWIELVRVLP